MDLLFSVVERALDGARRRAPRTALLVSVLLWLAAGAAYGWYTTIGSSGDTGHPVQWGSLARLTAPLLLLLLIVGIRGIAGVPVVAWPLGFVQVVTYNAVLGAVGSSGANPYAWVFSVWCFLFGQLFVTVVTNVDELARQRRYGPGGYGGVERERRTRRRLLQVRTLIALSSITVVLVGFNRDGTLDVSGGGGDLRVATIAGVCLVPLILLAVFVRVRNTARVAACGLLVAAGLVLLAVSPGRRAEVALQHGWLVFTASYLLLKAGTRWYWPLAGTAVPAVPTAPPYPPADPVYVVATLPDRPPSQPVGSRGPGTSDVVWIAVSLLVWALTCCTGGL